MTRRNFIGSLKDLRNIIIKECYLPELFFLIDSI